MTFKNILPTKRFDENFKEVVKPNMITTFAFHGRGLSDDKLDLLHERLMREYNQAQQRKVLVPLSEFVKELCKEHKFDFYKMVFKYTDYITQPITEQSLEGVECVVFKNGRCFTSKTFMMGYFYKTQTIEDALSDGVLFILKD